MSCELKNFVVNVLKIFVVNVLKIFCCKFCCESDVNLKVIVDDLEVLKD